MRILFVHQNFPAQYRYLAAALGRETRAEVVALAPGDGDVRLVLADAAGRRPSARARFVVGCDGAHSVVRTARGSTATITSA